MFFNIFKRKKKEINKSVEFSKEDLQWNKMWELWADEKIESPYYELMDYLSGINGAGHHCHFDNTFDNSKFYTRSAVSAKNVERILNEGWLHYDAIQEGLNDENQ